MEYLKAVFTLNVANEDMEAAKDLLADLAAVSRLSKKRMISWWVMFSHNC